MHFTKYKSEFITCRSVDIFDFSPWNALVSKTFEFVPCGYSGTYITPLNLKTNICYNIAFDCIDDDSMNILALDCNTNEIFEGNTQWQCFLIWLLINWHWWQQRCGFLSKSLQENYNNFVKKLKNELGLVQYMVIL